MGRALLNVCLLLFIIFKELSALKIQNKLLGKCLQVAEGTKGGRVSLGDCSPYSLLQEWCWHQESQALSSHHTGECLTAPREQYEGVHLQPCVLKTGSGKDGDGMAAVDIGRQAGSQAWTCSRKGHLTVVGTGLCLTATQESTLVFLSRRHKQGNKWRTFDSQTLCNGKTSQHKNINPHLHLGESLEPEIFSSYISDLHRQDETNLTPYFSTRSPADPMIFFHVDSGMSWKMAMVALSFLSLVMGTVIFILGIYADRTFRGPDFG